MYKRCHADALFDAATEFVPMPQKAFVMMMMMMMMMLIMTTCHQRSHPQSGLLS